MKSLPDPGSPLGIIVIVILLVVVAAIVRKLLRKRPPQVPPVPPAPAPPTEAEYLDSSHIIDVPPLAEGSARRARPPGSKDA